MTWIAAGTAAAGLVSSVIGSRSASRAAKQQQTAAESARRDQMALYGRAVSDYGPYTSLGTSSANRLMEGLTPNGDLMRRFSMEDFTKDPGYDFRLSEGTRGLEGSAAARGNVLSGAAQKALTKYGQNFASNEYGKAYDRYNTDQENRYRRLFGGTGVGLNATGAVTNAGMGYGTNSMNLMTGGANAGAAGSIAEGNAWNSGVGTITNVLQDYLASKNGTYSGGNLNVSNRRWLRDRPPQPYGEDN
jgi:hypothetical protein